MLLKKYLIKIALTTGLGIFSLTAQAEMVTAVNLTNSSIDFSVENGAGPLMGPNEDGSASGGSCCAYMPHWSPNLKVTVKWKADRDPVSYGKNPHKAYTDAWYDWDEKSIKKNVTYHKAEVAVPKYTKETAGDVVAIFLPCHQVMVVNTLYGYKHPNFPEKAKIQQRFRELTALEKAGNCPALQFPAKNKRY